ncbi:uncharacterized protein [Lepeophtheirus salmonis]|uniref:uncharacterized protein n=1 Tax=Lepeophtheirus salmonis TaxID=72036 RepID=UPI001AE5C2DF|nr:ras-related protein RABD2a-like [Lepeophtheirus salmonis]
MSFKSQKSPFSSSSTTSSSSSAATTNHRSSLPDEDPTYYKLVLVGDSGVGKSCLLEKLIDSSSKNTFISTIGFVIRTHVIVHQQNHLKLQVWDTGGQERYRPVLATCYRNASGAIIVFDITNPTSFLNLSQWLDEISEFSEEPLPKILVGNKADLSERRRVSKEEAQNFANKWKMAYIETSALESTNVKQAFIALILQNNKG